MNIKLKMGMFRALQDNNYESIYKSDYATFCYIALRYQCKNDVDLITTPKNLYKSLCDKEPTKDNIKGIKQGLEILENENIIYFNVDKSTYTITPENLDIDSNDKYFCVPQEYITKVLKQRNGIKLLHHYILLCSTINVIDNKGFHKREYFADALGIYPEAVTRHHQIFERLEIICFSKHRNGIDKEGNFVNLPKLYVMPKHKKLIEQMQEESIKKGIKESNKEINKKRKEERDRKKEEKERKSREESFGSSFSYMYDSFDEYPF